MAIKVGDRIPDSTLMRMSSAGPEAVTANQLFAGKKVVLFAVPGAFTPTCSASHLPGFVAKANEIRARGVDDIICVAVNDAFVMDAWGKQHGADGNVHMVADGNAAFSRALGLEDDRSDRGMGIRTQRCAMVVVDGVVEALRVEAPGQFSVSSAESMLELL